MTDQPMAPTKKVELSTAQRLQNILFGMDAGRRMIGVAIWYVRLCLHTRRQHNRFAGAPVTIQLFGVDPEDGLDILKTYNLRYAVHSIQWAIIDNQIGLSLYFMVSQASFDYVDNILSQYEGQTFEILSGPGCKRGQAIRRPYAQRQPTTKPSHQAKLGRTYGQR